MAESKVGKPKNRGLVVGIVTRQQARAKELLRYFTGAPCRRGHVCERLVSNGTCLDCQLETTDRARARDPERFKRYSAEAAERFNGRNPGYSREQYFKHRPKRDAYRNGWVVRNRERVREIKRAWKRRNPEWVRQWARKRSASLGRATPAWLTEQQHDEISAFYLDAAAREGPWHVDHIVPLQGKTVCGLHVPWNLQVLPALDNMVKGNRLLAA